MVKVSLRIGLTLTAIYCGMFLGVHTEGLAFWVVCLQSAFAGAGAVIIADHLASRMKGRGE